MFRLASSCGRRLQSFNASRNPGLTDALMPALIHACPMLKVLRLGHCSQLTDAGLIGLKLNQHDEELKRIAYGIGRGGDRSSRTS
jgi:hypothetical protein